MKKILAFAGSSSKNSINKQLVGYASQLLKSKDIEFLDLNDFPLPIFSIDLEKDMGFPDNAIQFSQKITDCSGILISLAEHNGSYTAVFKNLFDWLSRVNSKTWQNKPMLLMSSSPGGRGGQGVLEAAKTRFPRHDANVIEIFSLPNFNANFQNGKIINQELNSKLINAVESFENSLK